MTDDLVSRLRDEAGEWDEPKMPDEFDMIGLLNQAADAFEAKDAEIAKLREALGFYATTSLVGFDKDGGERARKELKDTGNG